MEILTVIRFIVFIVSFVMCCYQLNTATNQLMDPPTVDSTYERDITDTDMPLITVCPTLQTSSYGLSYHIYQTLLLGKSQCNRTSCTSWGANENKTYADILKRYNIMAPVYNISGGDFKNSSVFIPKHLECKETSHINVTGELVLSVPHEHKERVLITEGNYRSYFMPDITSQRGNKIFMEPKHSHYFDVQIQVKLFCRKDEKPMTQDEFKKCVDDKIQQEFEENNVECVPPWLSNNKQCNQTYPESFYGNFTDTFLKDYIDMVVILSNIKSEKECKQSCKETTYIVNEKGSKVKPFGSEAYITFNQKAIVTEKVPNYDMFKYIIDVGSSLGLWLGLSVLGLHDVVVWAVQFINKNSITKNIRSAVGYFY